MKSLDTAEQLLRLMEQMPRSAPQEMLNELSRGEHFILSYLEAHGGIGRPGELSAAMQTSTARTSAALGNMEKKGWLCRRPDEADHRQTLVCLTRSGASYLREMRRKVLEEIRLVLEELGERDAREYLRILGRMLEITACRKDQAAKGGPQG